MDLFTIYKRGKPVLVNSRARQTLLGFGDPFTETAEEYTQPPSHPEEVDLFTPQEAARVIAESDGEEPDG